MLEKGILNGFTNEALLARMGMEKWPKKEYDHEDSKNEETQY